MGMCPLLEYLSIESEERPGIVFSWIPLQQEQQPTPLPLRHLNFRNLGFVQRNIENLLSFTPRLKTLKLMVLETRIYPEYDWKRFLEDLKALGITLDSVHFSAFGHRSHLDILPHLSEICPTATDWSLWCFDTLKTVVCTEYLDLFNRRDPDSGPQNRQLIPPAIWNCRNLETLHIDIHGPDEGRILFGYVSRVLPQLVDLFIFIPEMFMNNVDYLLMRPAICVDLKGGFCLLSRLKHLQSLRVIEQNFNRDLIYGCSKAHLTWIAPSGRKNKYKRARRREMATWQKIRDTGGSTRGNATITITSITDNSGSGRC
ncbi:hypothetical protein BGZ96_004625 [Linnemannia gamsii]|uniref:F-box domain-containing protein n=1 Tax=Linnemannia gamsii TaxID=64522 RepID=A0ABQ7K873_9FUNG|nr:hypothetical protein BGZ96_004625 [Linnemannia gamsii]